ncbi:hypothetical protein DIPPA_27946 [Diplonema papillatum]|nr:hypothetical protein DIPPA_27946 [Diplonema papillatum]
MLRLRWAVSGSAAAAVVSLALRCFLGGGCEPGLPAPHPTAAPAAGAASPSLARAGTRAPGAVLSTAPRWNAGKRRGWRQYYHDTPDSSPETDLPSSCARDCVDLEGEDPSTPYRTSWCACVPEHGGHPRRKGCTGAFVVRAKTKTTCDEARSGKVTKNPELAGRLKKEWGPWALRFRVVGAEVFTPAVRYLGDCVYDVPVSLLDGQVYGVEAEVWYEGFEAFNEVAPVTPPMARHPLLRLSERKDPKTKVLVDAQHHDPARNLHAFADPTAGRHLRSSRFRASKNFVWDQFTPRATVSLACAAGRAAAEHRGEAKGKVAAEAGGGSGGREEVATEADGGTGVRGKVATEADGGTGVRAKVATEADGGTGVRGKVATEADGGTGVRGKVATEAIGVGGGGGGGEPATAAAAADGAGPEFAAAAAAPPLSPRCPRHGPGGPPPLRGRWVRVGSAPAVSEAEAFAHFERTDPRALYAWSPIGCHLPGFRTSETAAALEGKAVVFTGDSHARVTHTFLANYLSPDLPEGDPEVKRMDGLSLAVGRNTTLDLVNDILLEKHSMRKLAETHDVVVAGFGSWALGGGGKDPKGKVLEDVGRWSFARYTAAVAKVAREMRAAREEGRGRPGVRFIWATMPAYPPNQRRFSKLKGEYRTNPRIDLFNQAASRIMREHGVAVLDTFAPSLAMLHLSLDHNHHITYVQDAILHELLNMLCP